MIRTPASSSSLSCTSLLDEIEDRIEGEDNNVSIWFLVHVPFTTSSSAREREYE